MALSQQQWFEKLRSWVPSWWFEQDEYTTAVVQGMAALCASMQEQAEAHYTETFILEAVAPFLDAHGDERSLERFDEEEDAGYRERIRHLINLCNRPAIKAIVDALLLVGECEIREGYNNTAYADRGCYADRGDIIFEHFYNAFLIVVPPQTLPAEHFVDRDSYADRSVYAGSETTAEQVYAQIIASVDRAKALGVEYMVVETVN